MTIPTLTTLPVAPARTDPPATFVTRADAFLAGIVTFQGELNTSIGAMNTDIAGVNADALAAQAAQAAAELAESNAQTAETNAETAETNAQIYAAAAQAAAGVPSLVGNAEKKLAVNATETGVEWVESSSDPTKATLSQTIAKNESATLTLSAPITSGVPVVSVTKEVAQTGVTNNNWDASAGNYTLEDSAYSTTLDLLGYSIENIEVSKTLDTADKGSAVTDGVFSADGTKFFIVNSSDAVIEYDLSIAFDISSGVFSQSFSVAAKETFVFGLAFNNDGTRMFIIGQDSDSVHQYTLSVAFDVSSASFDQSFSTIAQTTSPRSLKFNSDGTKMFFGDGNTAVRSIYEFSLSSAFDISTLVFTQSYKIEELASLNGFAFDPTGTILIVVSSNSDAFAQYELSIGFDVSTAIYVRSTDILNISATPISSVFTNTGNIVFADYNTQRFFELNVLSPSSVTLGSGSFSSADIGKTINVNNGKLVIKNTSGKVVTDTPVSTQETALSGEWSMFALRYNSINDALETSGTIGDGRYDIDYAAYSGNSFDVSGQLTSPRGFCFNNDGSKMFVVGQPTQAVHEYALSVAFDITSASYVSDFSTAIQTGLPYSIQFNSDGTKMFVLSAYADIFEYDLSSGFDVTTAVYSQTIDIQPQESAPHCLRFNQDGTKMFVIGTTADAVIEYDLSTGFDISTAVFSQSFSVAAQTTASILLGFTPDGTKMFVSTGTKLIQYNLSTGFDVSTASYALSKIFSSSLYELNFNTDGSKMLVLFGATDSIEEFNVYDFLGATGLQTAISPKIDTTYWTDINSLAASDIFDRGFISYAVSNDEKVSWKILNNYNGVRSIARDNAGTWEYNSNNLYELETWTSASSNTEISALKNAVAYSSGGYDVNYSSYNNSSFSISAQTAQPYGIAFNTDGTKLFLAASTEKSIFEYDLSIAFDVSTSVLSQTLNMTAQPVTPAGIFFNSDGTKLFTSDSIADAIQQYNLSTGFDISTAVFSQSFSIASEVSTARGINFNSDGTKMFVVDATTVGIYEYNLSSGFDISTAVYSQNKNIKASFPYIFNIKFNNNGKKMFIASNATNQRGVIQYNLSTGFDISTAVFDTLFSSELQTESPRDLNFNSDGTKIFILSTNGIFEYSSLEYINRMASSKLNAITDANQISLGNELDFAAVFSYESGSILTQLLNVGINYDANVLNEGAIVGTDYDFDFPASDKLRITVSEAGNYKVRVV